LQNGQTVRDGCIEDVAIPHGRLVVVLASDSQNVFALDRRTGQLAWSTARQLTSGAAPVRYCLGVRDDCLYLASNDAVRCCKIDGGRALWEYRVAESFGRGILTDDAVYMPGDGKLLVIDLSPEKRADQDRLKRSIPVKRNAHEPLGNLASDGRNLFVIGMARIAMLGPDAADPPKSEDEY
jgi:outer membrane protein assembly factor BamB